MVFYRNHNEKRKNRRSERGEDSQRGILETENLMNYGNKRVNSMSEAEDRFQRLKMYCGHLLDMTAPSSSQVTRKNVSRSSPFVCDKFQDLSGTSSSLNASRQTEKSVYDAVRSQDTTSKKRRVLVDLILPSNVSYPTNKARDIALMEDGMVESSECGVFYVHSVSDNIRVVDTWACSCSCPAGQRPTICSHLCAVAMRDSEISFRLSLFAFVEYGLHRTRASAEQHTSRLEGIFNTIQQHILRHSAYIDHVDRNLKWTINAYIAALSRVLQKRNSRLPTVSYDPAVYEKDSDDNGGSGSGGRPLVHKALCGVVREICKNKLECIQQESALNRFIYFFKKLGKEYRSAVHALSVLNTLQTSTTQNNEELQQKSSSHSTNNISIIDLTGDTPSVTTTTMESSAHSSLLNTSATHKVISWLNLEEKQDKEKPKMTGVVSTQTEASKDPVKHDGEVEAPCGSVNVDQVINELVVCAPHHTCFLSLFGEASRKLNTSTCGFSFQQGICETLYPFINSHAKLGNLSKMSSPRTSNSALQKVATEMELVAVELLKTAFSIFPQQAFASYVVQQYLGLPIPLKDLERHGSTQSYYKSENQNLSCDEKNQNSLFDDRALCAEQLTRLHNAFFVDDTHRKQEKWQPVNSLSNEAAHCIENAPFLIDLVRYINWEHRFQTTLGDFHAFIHDHPRILIGFSTYRIVEVEFFVYMKIPGPCRDGDHLNSLKVALKNAHIVDMWNLYISGIWHNQCTKEDMEELIRSRSETLVVNWVLIDELYSWTPRSFFPFLKRFFSLLVRHRMEDTEWMLGRGINGGFSVVGSTTSPLELDRCQITSGDTYMDVDESSSVHLDTIGASSCVREDIQRIDEDGKDVKPGTLKERTDFEIDKTEWENAIREIRVNEFGLKEEHESSISALDKIQRERLARAIKRLSNDLYTSSLHFVLEIIQNADDNKYDTVLKGSKIVYKSIPALCIISCEEGVVFINNERGFILQDIRSLCDIGASSKTGCSLGATSASIGKFGIGFKSVFRYTDTPYVFSNQLGLNFDLQDASGIGALIPRYVKERWDTLCPPEVVKLIKECDVLPSTVLWLPKRSGQTEERETLNCVNYVSPLWLLFLNKLEILSLYDVQSSSTVYVERLTCDGTQEDGFPCTLCCLPCEFQHIILRIRKAMFSAVSVDPHPINQMLHFLMVKDRKGTLRVAFPINIKDREPLEANHNVFVHLPVRQMGLKFPCHANFVLVANREDILMDDPWNLQLLEGLGDLIGRSLASLATLLSPSILKLLPAECDLQGPLRKIYKPLLASLASALCIPHMSVNHLENTREHHNFVLPLYPSLCGISEATIKPTQIQQYSVHRLFVQIFTFQFSQKWTVPCMLRPVVCADFIHKASLDVCRNRLLIPNVSPWDILDRLECLQTYVVSTVLSNETLQYFSKLIGASFIVLDVLLDECEENVSFVIEAAKKLAIFPVEMFSENDSSSPLLCHKFIPLVSAGPSTVDTKVVVYQDSQGQTEQELLEHSNIFSSNMLIMLHRDIFKWYELQTHCESSVKNLGADQFLNQRLENMLTRFELYSLNSGFLPKYLFPLLQNKDIPTTVKVENVLAFVFLKNISGVTRMLMMDAFKDQHDPQVATLKTELHSVQIIMESVKSPKRPLGSRSFLTCSGGKNSKAFLDLLHHLAKPPMCKEHLTAALEFITCLRDHRVQPSCKYWTTSVTLQSTFWDSFFEYWGATPFWCLEDITYQVEHHEPDVVTITLLEYPTFFSLVIIEQIQEFLNTPVSKNRFRHSAITCERYTVVDKISVVLLLTVKIFALLDPAVMTQKGKEMTKCISLLCQHLLPLCTANANAKTSLTTDVLSSFVIQLRHYKWVLTDPCIHVVDLSICFSTGYHDAFTTDSPCFSSLSDTILYSNYGALWMRINNAVQKKHIRMICEENSALITKAFNNIHHDNLISLLEVRKRPLFRDSLHLTLLLANNIKDLCEEPDPNLRDHTKLSFLLYCYQLLLLSIANLYKSFPPSCCNTTFCECENCIAQALHREEWCIVYDEVTKTWTTASIYEAFWEPPKMLSSFKFSTLFSILYNMFKPLCRATRHLKLTSKFEHPTTCNNDAENVIKFFFVTVARIPENPTVDHLIMEVRYLSSQFQIHRQYGDEAQSVYASSAQILRCLYAYHILTGDLLSLFCNDHDNPVTKNRHQTSSNPTEEEPLFLMNSSLQDISLSNSTTDKEDSLKSHLPIFPVLVLGGSLELITFEELTSNSYVTLCITETDKRTQHVIEEMLEKNNNMVPSPKLVWEAFKLKGSNVLGDHVQSWWETEAKRLVRSKSLYQLYSLHYIGESLFVCSRAPFSDASLSFIVVLIFKLALPLLIRFIYHHCPLLLRNLHQDFDPNTLVEKFMKIDVQWTTSYVHTLWVSTLNEKSQGETTSCVEFLSLDSSQHSIVISTLLQPTDELNSLLLERLLFYLFPFTANIPFISTIAMTVTTFCVPRDILKSPCTAHKRLEFSDHLEKFLRSFANIADLPSQDENKDVEPVIAWYNRVWDVIEHRDIDLGISSTGLNILGSLLLYIDMADSVSNQTPPSTTDLSIIPYPEITVNEDYDDVDVENEFIQSSMVLAADFPFTTSDAYSVPQIFSTDNQLQLKDEKDLRKNMLPFYQEFFSEAKDVTMMMGSITNLEFHASVHNQDIRTHSQQTLSCIITGRTGEEVVFRFLKKCYEMEIARGFVRIIWLNELTESGKPYDISINFTPREGSSSETIYVEVKSTSVPNKSIFDISNAEWQFAAIHGEYFHVYRVWFLKKNYSIMRIRNPYMQWKKKKIKLYLSLPELKH